MGQQNLGKSVNLYAENPYAPTGLPTYPEIVIGDYHGPNISVEDYDISGPQKTAYIWRFTPTSDCTLTVDVGLSSAPDLTQPDRMVVYVSSDGGYVSGDDLHPGNAYLGVATFSYLAGTTYYIVAYGGVQDEAGNWLPVTTHITMRTSMTGAPGTTPAVIPMDIPKVGPPAPEPYHPTGPFSLNDLEARSGLSSSWYASPGPGSSLIGDGSLGDGSDATGATLQAYYSGYDYSHVVTGPLQLPSTWASIDWTILTDVRISIRTDADTSAGLHANVSAHVPAGSMLEEHSFPGTYWISPATSGLRTATLSLRALYEGLGSTWAAVRPTVVDELTVAFEQATFWTAVAEAYTADGTVSIYDFWFELDFDTVQPPRVLTVPLPGRRAFRPR